MARGAAPAGAPCPERFYVGGTNGLTGAGARRKNGGVAHPGPWVAVPGVGLGTPGPAVDRGRRESVMKPAAAARNTRIATQLFTRMPSTWLAVSLRSDSTTNRPTV